LAARYHHNSPDGLAAYTATCLQHVWRAQHFSSWMTAMLHKLDTQDDFGRKLQLTGLRNITESMAGSTYLAEGYVGNSTL